MGGGALRAGAECRTATRWMRTPGYLSDEHRGIPIGSVLDECPVEEHCGGCPTGDWRVRPHGRLERAIAVGRTCVLGWTRSAGSTVGSGSFHGQAPGRQRRREGRRCLRGSRHRRGKRRRASRGGQPSHDAPVWPRRPPVARKPQEPAPSRCLQPSSRRPTPPAPEHERQGPSGVPRDTRFHREPPAEIFR